jgi:hypothetical protein
VVAGGAGCGQAVGQGQHRQHRTVARLRAARALRFVNPLKHDAYRSGSLRLLVVAALGAALAGGLPVRA